MTDRKTSGAPQDESVTPKVSGAAPGGSSCSSDTPRLIPNGRQPRSALELLVGVIKRLNEKRTQGSRNDE
jgi:hypothetical protein